MIPLGLFNPKAFSHLLQNQEMELAQQNPVVIACGIYVRLFGF